MKGTPSIRWQLTRYGDDTAGDGAPTHRVTTVRGTPYVERVGALLLAGDHAALSDHAALVVDLGRHSSSLAFALRTGISRRGRIAPRAAAAVTARPS